MKLNILIKNASVAFGIVTMFSINFSCERYDIKLEDGDTLIKTHYITGVKEFNCMKYVDSIDNYTINFDTCTFNNFYLYINFDSFLIDEDPNTINYLIENRVKDVFINELDLTLYTKTDYNHKYSAYSKLNTIVIERYNNHLKLKIDSPPDAGLKSFYITYTDKTDGREYCLYTKTYYLIP